MHSTFFVELPVDLTVAPLISDLAVGLWPKRPATIAACR